MHRSMLPFPFLALIVGCAAPPFQAIDRARLIDLSHAQAEGTPAALTTRIEAPARRAEGGDTLDRVPLARFFGPLDVIDVRDRCRIDPDYRVGVDDLEHWEQLHGPILRGDIVVVRTGFEEHWPDPRTYLGSDELGGVTHLHFPGVGEEAARLLVSRGIDAVGIDTSSVDHGPSTDFVVQRIFAEANIPVLENLAGLGEVPARGTYVVALPVKIEAGAGGPCRVVALWR